MAPGQAQNFCSDSVDGTATIQLASQPYESVPASLTLSEYYGSGATLGVPQLVATGQHIAIAESNSVAWSLPTIQCRVQTVNAGLLPPGSYDVTWTTTETYFPPLIPPTRLRIRTFTFTILAVSAIPAADSPGLLALAFVLAVVAVWRLA